MPEFLTQFTFFAFFQSLFLLAIFLVSKGRRQQMNPYLFILVCLLTIGLMGKIGQFAWDWQRQLKGLAEFSILFFGPTVYLFVQSTLSEKRLSRADFIHYIPGIVYSLIITFYYITAPEEVIQERYRSGELIRVVRILVGIGLTVNFTYFGLSMAAFLRLKKGLQEEMSYLLNVRFVQYFLTAIGVCLLVWLTVYLLSFGENPELEIDSRELIWLAVALIVLFIAYFQMVSPRVFQFEKVTPKTKYAQSKFSPADLERLKSELEALMQEKKPYLNAKLLKSELAEMMSINAPELSRLLNESIGMTFFEYVNYHRIHEFIRLAQSPLVKQKTLLGLAQEAGFQSKSTFHKSFKLVMGCPPSAYLKQAQD